MCCNDQSSDEPTSNNTCVGHCQADQVDVNIGRGSGYSNITTADIGDEGWLGNPFVPKENSRRSHYISDAVTVVDSRRESISQFRKIFEERLCTDSEFRQAVKNLLGKRLGCWCRRVAEQEPACHGGVIREHVERLNSQS